MKITITLEDQENGAVKIDTVPEMPKIIAANREKDRTPAEQYAVVALAMITKFSASIAQEKYGIKGHIKVKLH